MVIIARTKKEATKLNEINKTDKQINNTYLITIDKKLIHEYHLQYIKKHPTAKSLPFARLQTVKVINKDGSPKLTKGGNQATKKQSIKIKDYTIDDCLYGTMSLNELLVINDRMMMNAKKEKWGDLGVWIAEKYNLNDLNMTNSLVEFRIFGETNANRDNDNISAGIKFLNDGMFVKSHMFTDDNWHVINPLLICGGYDKEHPRTEIRISIFDDDIKDEYEKLIIHIENFKDKADILS